MNELSKFFKMLSDETRIRIINLLYHEELCVCEICGILELSQPKVSKHLAKLRDIGFVEDERKEQFVFYKLNIQDEVLKATIKNLADNIKSYPMLNNDVERLVQKDSFLEICRSK